MLYSRARARGASRSPRGRPRRARYASGAALVAVAADTSRAPVLPPRASPMRSVPLRPSHRRLGSGRPQLRNVPRAEGGLRPPDGGVDVVFHFHAGQMAEREMKESGVRAVFVSCGYGMGSGAYADAFANPERFGRMLTSSS